MPRDPNHDYRSRSIYHITMTKMQGIPDFSKVVGFPQRVKVWNEPVGNIILNNIRLIESFTPKLQNYQYIIMPDHIHLLIYAKEYLDYPLGSYIGKFKVKVGQQVRESFPSIQGPVFEEDFYDRILRPTHNLDIIFKYIKENPYRLAIRKACPDFFKRVYNIPICSRRWQAYGNLQLLANPFKGAVIVHRRDPDIIKERNRETWLHLAANGGVLVSPFISEAEKEIRSEAENAGAKIILLTDTPFPDRFKPARHNFSLCEQGRLLILAPTETLPKGRQTFLFLNRIAEEISLPNSAAMPPEIQS